MPEERKFELLDFLDEMIALGWRMDTFDEDFDIFVFNSDEVFPEEKEECRKLFEYLWEDRPGW